MLLLSLLLLYIVSHLLGGVEDLFEGLLDGSAWHLRGFAGVEAWLRTRLPRRLLLLIMWLLWHVLTQEVLLPDACQIAVGRNLELDDVMELGLPSDRRTWLLLMLLTQRACDGWLSKAICFLQVQV